MRARLRPLPRSRRTRPSTAARLTGTREASSRHPCAQAPNTARSPWAARQPWTGTPTATRQGACALARARKGHPRSTKRRPRRPFHPCGRYLPRRRVHVNPAPKCVERLDGPDGGGRTRLAFRLLRSQRPTRPVSQLTKVQSGETRPVEVVPPDRQKARLQRQRECTIWAGASARKDAARAAVRGRTQRLRARACACFGIQGLIEYPWRLRDAGA